MRKKKNLLFGALLCAILLFLPACSSENTEGLTSSQQTQSVDLSSIPAYSGQAYIEVNNNIPDFSESDLTTTSFEKYSDLDELGRCGVAYANVGKDTMPTEKRGSIGQVKPSGWHTIKYDNVDGKYLYNRCHLIGYQLTAENANEKNLITGTRYLNINGMLDFENMVADYVKETNNHVLYRVTPVFEGDNLVASGVQMEAMSVEDHGAAVQFNVYCYNVQPEITIDYSNGDSHHSSDSSVQTNNSKTEKSSKATEQSKESSYILNTNTKKFHLPSCPSVSDTHSNNKYTYTGNRDDLIKQGYDPCKNCNP